MFINVKFPFYSHYRLSAQFSDTSLNTLFTVFIVVLRTSMLECVAHLAQNQINLLHFYVPGNEDSCRYSHGKYYNCGDLMHSDIFSYPGHRI